MHLLSKDEHNENLYSSSSLRDIFLHSYVVVKHRLHQTFLYRSRQWLYCHHNLLFYAVDSLTAKETAQALLQHFDRFGAPNRLRSDQGSRFINEVIKEFLMLVCTDHEITIVYSKPENTIAEHAKKEVNRLLCTFL